MTNPKILRHRAGVSAKVVSRSGSTKVSELASMSTSGGVKFRIIAAFPTSNRQHNLDEILRIHRQSRERRHRKNQQDNMRTGLIVSDTIKTNVIRPNYESPKSSELKKPNDAPDISKKFTLETEFALDLMKGLDINVANDYDFMVKYPEGQSLASYQYSNRMSIDHNVLAIHRSKRTG